MFSRGPNRLEVTLGPCSLGDIGSPSSPLAFKTSTLSEMPGGISRISFDLLSNNEAQV
ncbi:MAG: hypothetical protein R3A13_08330 [Bdellovibrionota bacterium]